MGRLPRHIAVNQDGAWHTCRAAARVLGAQGEGGRIIVISSIGGLVGIAVGAHYVMSKHAVMGLVRVLSRQLAGSGITVNAINPGYARTQTNALVLADAGYLARVEAETPWAASAGARDDIAGRAHSSPPPTPPTSASRFPWTAATPRSQHFVAPSRAGSRGALPSGRRVKV